MTGEAISSLLVGLGTLALAVAAFSSLIQTKKQLNVLSRQLDIQQRQLRPTLLVKSFSFNENQLHIAIENISVAAAQWVGISTRFYLVYPLYFDSSDSNQPLSGRRITQMHAENKQLYVKYQLLGPGQQPKLTYDGNTVRPEECVIFAGDDIPGATILPHETRSADIEPLFYITTGAMLGIAGRAFKFNEFRDFLLQMDIDWVAVSFSVIFKDITEDKIKSEWVTKFAFNTQAASDLADANAHSSPVFFLPLSASEIHAKNRFLPGLSYRNMRTPE